MTIIITIIYTATNTNSFTKTTPKIILISTKITQHSPTKPVNEKTQERPLNHPKCLAEKWPERLGQANGMRNGTGVDVNVNKQGEKRQQTQRNVVSSMGRRAWMGSHESAGCTQAMAGRTDRCERSNDGLWLFIKRVVGGGGCSECTKQDRCNILHGMREEDVCWYCKASKVPAHAAMNGERCRDLSNMSGGFRSESKWYCGRLCKGSVATGGTG